MQTIEFTDAEMCMLEEVLTERVRRLAPPIIWEIRDKVINARVFPETTRNDTRLSTGVELGAWANPAAPDGRGALPSLDMTTEEITAALEKPEIRKLIKDAIAKMDAGSRLSRTQDDTSKGDK